MPVSQGFAQPRLLPGVCREEGQSLACLLPPALCPEPGLFLVPFGKT